MALSPKLGLPLLSENQSAAEFVFNEVMIKLDSITQLQAIDYTATPPTLTDGLVYLVADSATGAWANQDEKIAYSNAGIWKFIIPHDGMVAFVTSGDYAGKYLRYSTSPTTTWKLHIGYKDMINGHIVVPVAMDYCIELKAQSAYTIDLLTAETRSGTCDIAIKHATGTETVLSVSDSQTSQVEDVDIAVSGKVELVISNITEVLDLQFQIQMSKDTL